MTTLNSNSSTPLYQQLYDVLLKKIQSGEFQPGDKIPSEPRLSVDYGVSRITVRSTLQQLSDEGWLLKRHGKGTFVSSHMKAKTVLPGGSFTQTCLRMNAVPSTKIITCQLTQAPKSIAEFLQLPPSSEAILVQRLRFTDHLPCIFETDYFPLCFSFLLEEDLCDKSLLQLIAEKSGRSAIQFEDHFEIQFAKKNVAPFLECRIGFPLMKISQNIFDYNGHPFYFNEQLIRSDRYVYAVRSNADNQ